MCIVDLGMLGNDTGLISVKSVGINSTCVLARLLQLLPHGSYLEVSVYRTKSVENIIKEIANIEYCFLLGFIEYPWVKETIRNMNNKRASKPLTYPKIVYSVHDCSTQTLGQALKTRSPMDNILSRSREWLSSQLLV